MDSGEEVGGFAERMLLGGIAEGGVAYGALQGDLDDALREHALTPADVDDAGCVGFAAEDGADEEMRAEVDGGDE